MFPDYSYNNDCKNVQDLMFAESNYIKLGMEKNLVDQIFKFFEYEAVNAGYSLKSIKDSFE